MLTNIVVIMLLIFIGASGRILLYNTENGPAVEKFDCMYYLDNDGAEIPYCRLPDGSQVLHRQHKNCENHGENHFLRALLDQNIQPNNILD